MWYFIDRTQIVKHANAHNFKLSTLQMSYLDSVVRPFVSFNVGRKYFYRSRAHVFWARQRWGIIYNFFRLRYFYVSTSYNWICSFQQSHRASALQFSLGLQGILVEVAILYILVLQTSRNTLWRLCYINHIQIVDLICSKPFFDCILIIFQSHFRQISHFIDIYYRDWMCSR